MKLFSLMMLFSANAFALNCPFTEQNNQYSQTVAICENVTTGQVACLAKYTKSGNYIVEVSGGDIRGDYRTSFGQKAIKKDNAKRLKLKYKTFGLGIIGYQNFQFELNKKNKTAKFKYKTIGCGISIINDGPDPYCPKNIDIKFTECQL
tara:strand:+ start:1009 stop:1455 length:447 start_codon:yes stop_codon:yes gene_type:complete